MGSNSTREKKFLFHFREKPPVICLHLSVGIEVVYYQSRVDGVNHPLFMEQTADVSIGSLYLQ